MGPPPPRKPPRGSRPEAGLDGPGARTELVLRTVHAVEETIRVAKLTRAERKLLLQYLCIPAGQIVCVGLPAQMINTQVAPKPAKAKDPPKAVKKTSVKKTPKPNKSPYEAVQHRIDEIRSAIAEANSRPNSNEDERRSIIQALRLELKTVKNSVNPSVQA